VCYLTEAGFIVVDVPPSRQARTTLKESKMATVVKMCTCEHEYQDKRYGRQRRLHNESNIGHRCTVCGINKKDEKRY